MAFALAYALQYVGRRRHHRADWMMAALMAEHLLEHLTRSGFVIMRKPPIGGSAPAYPMPAVDEAGERKSSVGSSRQINGAAVRHVGW